MIIGGSALVIWMSINNTIIDNMNQKACSKGISGNSEIVDSVQGLYIWLTIIMMISFTGVVRGIKGITEERDIYNVKEIFSLIYIAGTLVVIFIAAITIGSNPIIKAMTSEYSMVNPDTTMSKVPIHANHTISSFLTTLTIVSSIAMIGVFLKGKEFVEDKKVSPAAPAASGEEIFGNYDGPGYNF